MVVLERNDREKIWCIFNNKKNGFAKNNNLSAFISVNNIVNLMESQIG